MKTISIKRKLLYLLLGFITLFTLRLGYGYWIYPNGKTNNTAENARIDTDGFVLERKNYASSKGVSKESGQASTAMGNIDQKYEKIGALASATDQYERDEVALYALIKQEQLMIQLEQRAGLPLKRQLNIALGVVPDKFDSTVEALKQIGTLKSIQIDKNDKTNEYKKLEAQRVSLQKARDSLLELKASNGGVHDMIELTNRLLEVENQIQALGVNLGEFDEQNEFCTVKFSLREIRPSQPSYISLTHRIKTTLYWTGQMYFFFWLVVVLGLLALWLSLSIVKKASGWSREK